MDIITANGIGIWTFAAFTLALLGVALAVLSVWPPIHPRRLVGAFALCAASAGLYLGSSGVNLRPILRLAVIVECGAIQSQSFPEQLQSAASIMRKWDVATIDVLPGVTGSTCDIPPTVTASLTWRINKLQRAVGDSLWDTKRARDRAREVLSSRLPRFSPPRACLLYTSPSPRDRG